MRNSFQILIVTIFVLGMPLLTTAQYITGSTTPSVGSTHTYSYNTGTVVFSPQWQLSVGRGTMTNPTQSGTTYSVTITWSSTGSETLVLMDGFMPVDQLNITVSAGVPPAPTASAATSITATSFTANWSFFVGATNGYRLDVSTVSNFATFVSGYNNLACVSNYQNVTGLTPGTTYYYRARAVNITGASPNSGTITAVTLPAAPTANAATSMTAAALTANWSAPLSATSYRLDVSTVNTFATFVSGYNNLTVAGTSQIVSGLSGGTTYYYRVRAVNGSGTSANSGTITALTTPVAPVANPGTNIYNTEFTASWSPVASATSYLLDVSTVNTFVSFVSGYNGLSVSGTTRAVTGLATGTNYFYRVRGVNASGASVSSPTVSVGTTLIAPVANAATSITSSSFTANWSSSANAISYRLDVSSKSDFSILLSGYNNLTVSGTSQNVTGLAPKTSYYYRVRAVNAIATSANSNVIIGADLDHNYVRSVNIVVPGKTTPASVANPTINEAITSYSFLDGLGRPSQSVTYQGSPSQKDLVQPMAYDVYGREVKKYLPYTDETNGWFKPNAIRDPNSTGTEQGQYITGKQYLFYQTGGLLPSDQYPYAETRIEPSPENRVVEQGSPGLAWQPDATDSYTSTDRTVKSSQETNVASEVLVWTYTYPSASYPLGLVNTGTGTTPAYYAAGKIFRSRTKDEQHNEVIEYKDKLGRVVLKRVQLTAGTPTVNDANYASTYYIYDGFGNLAVVIPPEATRLLASDYYHSGATDATKDAFLRRWAFRYTYDSRLRMSQKQVPGADPVYIVYDKRDRTVLTQDGNQRTPKNWTFTKYDALNRPIMTGIYTHGTVVDQAAMQTHVNSLIVSGNQFYEDYTGAAATEGYTTRVFPTTSASPLTVNYYDNYNFRSLWVGTYTYTTDALTQTVNTIPYTQPTAENQRVTGQATGTKVKVLDGGVVGGYTWLKTVSYYDDKYRVIQTLADNYKGGVDRVSNLYDFSGKVLMSKQTHTEADVTWKDLVGVKQEGNKLVRTVAGQGWGTSGAASVQQLPAGQNGWMEFVASETNLYRMVGLSDVNTNASYLTIDYAWYPAISGALHIYESGTNRGAFGTYQPGDVLKIDRTGTSIKYYQNNALKYTSTVASSSLLMVDAAFYDNTSTLVNVRSSFGATSKVITRRFEYDNSNRLIRTWHKIDTQPEILLALNSYNELGQLVDKKLHSTVSAGTDAKQSVDYLYNIRGWLTKINNSDVSTIAPGDAVRDHFGMELGYNGSIGTGNTGLFNGNISGVKWSVNQGYSTMKEMGYNYTYDPMNRLATAIHRQSSGTWGAGQFDESGFGYDLNGNIQALTRKGDAGVQIDNLLYNYGTGVGTAATTGNKLLYVQDNTAIATDKAKGFVDGNIGTATDYSYDVNGNMTRDLNKGIGTTLADANNLIVYNYLNLPETVTKGGNSVRYIYDASGRKLAQLVIASSAQKKTDYAGEFVYENDALQFVNTEEGRIMIDSSKLIVSDAGLSTTTMTAVNAVLQTFAGTNGEKYIKVISGSTVARTGVFPIGGTITVQPGQRYRIRARGYYAGSNPVYISIKAGGNDLNWPGALLPPGAVTESWVEQIVTIPTGATTLQAGLTWNTTVADGDIFYVNDFEVTQLLTNTRPEYQYHVKDHLGNVRVTFTTKDETLQYTASLENATQSAEQANFKNYSRVTADLFDHTDAGTTYDKAQLLNGGNNSQVGLAKSLAVMPGDVVSAQVWAKHYGATGSSGNLAGFASALLTAFGLPAPGGGELGTASAALQSYGSFIAGGGNPGNTSWPKGFLNILIFDKNYNLIDLAYQQLDAAYVQPVGNGVKQPHQLLSLSKTIKEPGYVYIYLSNEGSVQKDIYFDDLAISHAKSKVLQTDDYYPFGLNYNSYQRENTTAQDYKYNSKELQDELGLNWLDYGWRMYIPEIGRWNAIDMLADKYFAYSPFNYVANNPMRFTDPDGTWIKGKDGKAVTWEVNKDGSLKWSENAKKSTIKQGNRLWSLGDKDLRLGSSGKNALYKMAQSQAEVKLKISEKSSSFEMKSKGSFQGADGQTYAGKMKVTIGLGMSENKEGVLTESAEVMSSHLQDEKVNLSLNRDALSEESGKVEDMSNDPFFPYPDHNPLRGTGELSERALSPTADIGYKTPRQIEMQNHVTLKNEMLQRRRFREPKVE